MFSKRNLTHESGQALIQVAISMLVLLAFVALATDVGSLYAERRKMQNAADAGALAGAMVLCVDGEAAARTSAFNMALANGAQLQAADITIDLANGLVSVPVSTTAHSIFARLMNISFATSDVRARATAKCGTINSIGSGAMPIIVQNINFIKGDTYDLLDPLSPGNFGWLTWEGPVNEPYLEAELQGRKSSDLYVDGAVPNRISVGDFVQGLTGYSNGVKDDIINLQGQTITILVYDFTNSRGGSNTDYHVVGFAQFELGPYDFVKKILPGKFVDMVTALSTSTGGPNYGVYGARLTQ